MEFENTVSDAATPHEVIAFAQAIIEGESDRIATLANISALIGQYLPRINWAGFYLFAPGTQEGVLGPFQGQIACTRIALGSGVVGTCAQQGKTIVVPDVDQFPGHIACDKASRSEIVVPIRDSHDVVAVLDVDAPILDRFQAEDQFLLESIAALLSKNWSSMRTF
ncbi:histidine kinase [Sulfobacillus thermotolerans]|uniref:Histidine kinase n=1 Tax=Sulfobacillus thermotolerans TaxID=338644 RepID=A0ABM6RUE9_9FIRM|nr:histidine kinase [Sulfobacillus thermotolerans]